MRRLLALTAVVIFGLGAWAQDNKPQGEEKKPGDGGSQVPAERKALTWDKANSPLDFVVQDIEGRDVDLTKYKGNVVLIVNVASKCGLTPQYKDLQALHQQYHAKGLRILAFPSNDFGSQEPGTDAQIKEFCLKHYGVRFDLFSKVAVKGERAAELYKYLTAQEKTAGNSGDIKWNFTKFLVNRKGEVVARFEPRVKPDDPEVIRAIEAALEAKDSKEAK